MSERPALGDWTSPEDLQRLQRSRLRAVLEAAGRSPFYRDRLPAPATFDLDAWDRLPLTTKADLRSAHPLGLLAVPFADLATVHESSGTTGVPTASYLTESDWLDIASRFARSSIDMGSGDAVLVNTPFSMLTTAHQMHRAARLRDAVVIPAGNRTWNMPYRRVAQLLHDLPISVWWCVPTNALLVALAARFAGYDPARGFEPLRAILVAGEALSEARRRRLSALWGGRRVVQDYGSTETGSLAGECSHGRLHLWADRLLCEVLDPTTGRASSEGTGELVITPLHREAMPLIRYRMEDTVEIRHEPCPCGWHLPTVRIIGRASTLIATQGHRFYPVELEDVVYDLPAEHGVLLWRARHDPHELEIEIEVEGPRADRARAALEQDVRRRLDITARVRAVAPGTIVPLTTLIGLNRSLKPTYVFSNDEGWPRDYRW